MLYTIFVVVLLFGLSLGVLINNYRLKSNEADVSERELFLVRERAGRDALTGVKNKLAYTEREHEMDRMIQEKQAAPFSLAVLDVNGLKHVNDTLGHQEGDRLIQEACRIICTEARELGISMPITEQLYQVLFEHKKPSEAIYQLMTRSLKEEE